jgi:hypothetical protein
VYAALREAEPVRRMPDGSFFLTRHADLLAVYRDAQAFSSDKKVEFEPKYGAASALFEHHTTTALAACCQACKGWRTIRRRWRRC